jgi:lipoprotein-anchoring transpeptidase ErfK/SrfK
VLEKREKHRSNLYDAEMPYMLRLTNDGIAIHASEVRQGAATHGCIGIPVEFARALFREVRRGDEVFITS